MIGAGNIGSAIAKGLSQGNFIKSEDIFITDIRQEPLTDMNNFDSKINTPFGNYDFVENKDIVLVAVKPWVIKETIEILKPHLDYSKQMIVSIVAGVTCSDLKSMFDKGNGETPAIFRVMPNTAIAVRESMTMVCACDYSAEQKQAIMTMFNELGKAMFIEEKLLGAGTALASCGIAYAMRYIRAAMIGGVEMGFYANDAKEVVTQTVLGAAKLLETNRSHPEIEIDKVTTPMGITIKGLNEMELAAFTSAVIRGLKASNSK